MVKLKKLNEEIRRLLKRAKKHDLAIKPNLKARIKKTAEKRGFDEHKLVLVKKADGTAGFKIRKVIIPRKLVSFKLPPSVIDTLALYADATKQSKTAVVELALTKVFRRAKKNGLL